MAARLHAYLQVDVAAILSLPYDVRGLYNDDVLRAPELAEQAQRRAEIHDLTRELIDAGIAGGELVPFDTGFVQHAITRALLEVVRERGAAPSTAPAARALDVADFVLRHAPRRPAAGRRSGRGPATCVPTSPRWPPPARSPDYSGVAVGDAAARPRW